MHHWNSIKPVDRGDGKSNRLIHPETVKVYARDLKETLSEGAIVEQRAFLRWFIQQIDVNHPEVRIEYKLPCVKKKAELLSEEVLPIDVFSSPDWTVIELFHQRNSRIGSRLLWGRSLGSFMRWLFLELPTSEKLKLNRHFPKTTM